MRSQVICVQSEKFIFALIANNSGNKNHTTKPKKQN